MEPKIIIAIIAGGLLVFFGVLVLVFYLWKKHVSAKIKREERKEDTEIEMKEQNNGIVITEYEIINDSIANNRVEGSMP